MARKYRRRVVLSTGQLTKSVQKVPIAFVGIASNNSSFRRDFNQMTVAELQKLVEEIGVKVNTLATLQLTIATTVNEGLRTLLASSNALLVIAQSHENRIERLEGK